MRFSLYSAKKLISPKIDQDLPTNGIRPLLKIIGFVPIIERREKFYYAFLEILKIVAVKY